MHFLQCWDIPNLISCISFYNIFLCLFHRRSDLEHAAGMFCSQARGLDTKTTQRGFFHGLPGSQARGLDAAKLLDADSCEDRRQEKFYTACHDFWILYSKSWNLDSRLGGCGTRVIDAYFSNFWKIKTRRLKTDLTLGLILRFNLRLGGYSIWSASSSRNI